MLVLHKAGDYNYGMITEKLFYKNVYMKEFEAVVLNSSFDEKKKSWLVELDRTAFYPEGGGQPADEGTLSTGEGIVRRVMDVHEKEGTILHYCDGPLDEGMKVRGQLDWERRFDHMQQHSGEHIVSGMICSRFHCDNVGFHMGKDTVVIDYNAEVSRAALAELEEAANRYIWEDHALQILWPTPEELKALEYRSKKELTGDVRITSFPGADICACCGTHVMTSGQVGLVKFIGSQKFSKGTRIELLCGKRAFDFLSMNWEQNHQVSVAMASSLDKTAAVYQKQKQELIDAKMKISELEGYYFEQLADEYRGAGDILLIREPMTPDNVRKLCVMIAERCGGRCVLFAGEGRDYKYAYLDQHADPKEVMAKVREMNGALSGRGGGRDGFAQGSAAASKKEIEAYFSVSAAKQ